MKKSIVLQKNAKILSSIVINETDSDRRVLIPLSRGAYSDESGHLFRFVSDTDPTISDSCRSEATLGREQ